MAPPTVEIEPKHFINRELSWLEFNQRVLDEALDKSTPLLERLKFFCISSSNLDEFFEVRVAGLKQQIESEVVERSFDGLTASETLRAVTKRIRKMVDSQYKAWRNELRPALSRKGIKFIRIRDLKRSDLTFVEKFYREQVRPVSDAPGHRSLAPLSTVAQQVVEHDCGVGGHRPRADGLADGSGANSPGATPVGSTAGTGQTNGVCVPG